MMDQVNFLVGRIISIERFSSQEVKVKVKISRFAGVLLRRRRLRWKDELFQNGG
jgi:hypothetical protein